MSGMDDFWSECGEEAHHYTYYHKESCNGFMHSIVCNKPSYHDQMSSRDVCTENCRIYRRRYLEADDVDQEHSGVDEVDAFASSHAAECHSEFCNGYTHATLCDKPEVHNQMTSYFLCNENCGVYQLRQKNLKIRMTTPNPKECEDPYIRGVDEVDACNAERDTLPIDDLLQVTPEHSPSKQAELHKKLMSSKALKKKKNTFSDLHRRLRLLEDRMKRLDNSKSDGSTASNTRAPRRIHLKKP